MVAYRYTDTHLHSYTGLARTIHIRCIYTLLLAGTSPIYSHIQCILWFWPTLIIRHIRGQQLTPCSRQKGTPFSMQTPTDVHAHTHTHTHIQTHTPQPHTCESLRPVCTFKTLSISAHARKSPTKETHAHCHSPSTSEGMHEHRECTQQGMHTHTRGMCRLMHIATYLPPQRE
jgi:hypothetical protein